MRLLRRLLLRVEQPLALRLVLPLRLLLRLDLLGQQLTLPLELEFFGDDYGPASDEPLRRTQARRLFTRSSLTSQSSLEVKTSGVAWGLVELSSIEALLCTHRLLAGS